MCGITGLFDTQSGREVDRAFLQPKNPVKH
jgi:hypothetical protein